MNVSYEDDSVTVGRIVRLQVHCSVEIWIRAVGDSTATAFIDAVEVTHVPKLLCRDGQFVDARVRRMHAVVVLVEKQPFSVRGPSHAARHPIDPVGILTGHSTVERARSRRT